MKQLNILKSILFTVFLCLTSIAFAQDWILFTGTVTNDSTGQPVSDYPVYITVNDSMLTRTVFTNTNGIFADTIYNDPAGIEMAEVVVYDCNQLAHTVQFSEIDTINVADFSICVNSNDQCQAYFESKPDSLDFYTMHFFNLSQGNFTSWFWTFGDGTGSGDYSPDHQFNSPGIYQVCLTVQDSSGSCDDTFCQYIQVGEEACNADFYWQTDGSDPLHIYFMDISTGNISNWLWNFGDSNQSTEQFPDHQYSEAGQYMVTLIVSDSSGICYDSISKLVLVGGDASCVADFSFSLDTMNNTPYVYHFIDESEGIPQYWLWNFGDGTVSYDQNPEHIYQEGGTYQVCLTISDNNPLGDCYDTICKTITTPGYFDFGGQVFIGEYPLNIEETDSSNRAVAYLFRKFMNKWELMDTREFWKYGYYWFSDKPAGEYIIRTDLLPESLEYGNYSPVYHENSNYWTQAKVFTLNDGEQYAVNLQLFPVELPEAGPGAISGYLHPGSGCPGTTGVDNELVYLLDDNYKVMLYTYTNENGAYSFDALGYGTYFVKAETTGKTSQRVAVQISEGEPSAGNIELEMDCNSYVSVDEYKIENNLLLQNVYPQPASDHVSIELNLKENDRIRIHMINIEGKICLAKSIQMSGGNQEISMDVHALNPGLYVLKISGSEYSEMVIKKIIIY